MQSETSLLHVRQRKVGPHRGGLLLLAMPLRTDAAAGKALLRALLASLLGTAVCKKFEMDGRCAAVVKLQKWMKEDLVGDGETANWDYKIKVDPWTVFGQVHVRLKGKKMRLEHVYGGTAPVGGSSFAVALSPVPLGDDNLFEISGLGEPEDDPEFTCSNLLSVRGSRGTCDTRRGHPQPRRHLTSGSPGQSVSVVLCRMPLAG